MAALTLCSAYFGQLGDPAEILKTSEQAEEILTHFAKCSRQGRQYRFILKKLSEDVAEYVKASAIKDRIARNLAMPEIFGSHPTTPEKELNDRFHIGHALSLNYQTDSSWLHSTKSLDPAHLLSANPQLGTEFMPIDQDDSTESGYLDLPISSNPEWLIGDTYPCDLLGSFDDVGITLAEVTSGSTDEVEEFFRSLVDMQNVWDLN